MKSRAQAKIANLGLENLSADEIRQAVLQAQPEELNPTVERVPAAWPQLTMDALQLQPNGAWLLQDRQGFRVDLAQFLQPDQPIRRLVLRRCRHFHFSSNSVEMVIPESWDDKRLLLFDQCQDFVLADLGIEGSRNPVTLNRCSRFCIERLSVRQARGYGLTLLRCDAGTVRDGQFLSCLASGINIVGQCRELHVQHCRISGSTGLFNWDAGINCMHCSSAVTLQEVPDSSHEAIDLREKLDTPHRIWIEDCEISQCRAQGIYLEGAAQVLIEECFIADNNKEGICFDWGTSLSHLRHSQIIRNGERAEYDESACAIDFLPSKFRDSKGRHWCQLPGISIDNGYANVIECNLIAANYGGAIKIVRSGFGNLIRFNGLGGNSNKLSFHDEREAPVNPYQPSEIKILNMGPGNQEEFDNEMAYLDFLPPAGNIIYGNLISGRGSSALIPRHIRVWDPEQALRDNQVDL